MSDIPFALLRYAVLFMQLPNVLPADVQVLSDTVQQAGLREGQHVALDLQISAYVDDAGACDRIQKTCIPQSYTRHTSREFLQALLSEVHMHEKGGLTRSCSQFMAAMIPNQRHQVTNKQSLRFSLSAGFLIIFLTFLPFTLWEVTGWLSPLAEALIAFLFMGIDNIGDCLFDIGALLFFCSCQWHILAGLIPHSMQTHKIILWSGCSQVLLNRVLLLLCALKAIRGLM